MIFDVYFEAGVDAFASKLTQAANPHPMDAAPRKLWNMGFNYACLMANVDKVNAEPLAYVPAQPFEQGRNAFTEGKPVDFNPYDYGDPNGTEDERKTWEVHYDWRNGWYKARDAAAINNFAADAKVDDFVEEIKSNIADALDYRLSKSELSPTHSPGLFTQQMGRILRPNKASGGHNDYWRVAVEHPTREGVEPYTAEFEDIAEALKLTPREYNEAKAIWRTAGARLGNGKPGATALYDAQKRVHYAKLDLATYERESKEASALYASQPSEEDRQP